MSGRKTFTAGEVLQAADVNDYLMDQSVMVFAGTAARGSAIPSPTEGMVTYRSDDDAVEVYDGSTWNAVGPGQILQVVSTTKTDTFSASVATTAVSSAITGLTPSITPSSSSSKIFVTFSLSLSGSIALPTHIYLYRDGSAISIGDAAGNRARATTGAYSSPTSEGAVNASANFLDSPATTSSVTYDIRFGHTSSSTRTIYVNRQQNDGDIAEYARFTSTITLMEVAA